MIKIIKNNDKSMCNLISYEMSITSDGNTFEWKAFGGGSEPKCKKALTQDPTSPSNHLIKKLNALFEDIYEI